MNEHQLLRRPPQRVHYSDGQFLTLNDFTEEQEYHRFCLQRNNMMLYEPGVVLVDQLDSLAVKRKGNTLFVEPGVALDPLGRHLVLYERKPLEIWEGASGSFLIVVAYREQPVEPAQKGEPVETRYNEEAQAILCAVDKKPAACVTLATIEIDESGADPVDQRKRITPIRQFNTDAVWTTRATFLPHPVHFLHDDKILQWMGVDPGGAGLKEQFVIHGTHASSGDQGAAGCVEIPIPSGAAAISRLSIFGARVEKQVTLGLFRNDGEKCTATGIFAERITEQGKPFQFHYTKQLPAEMTDYHTTLVLFVIAQGSADIHALAADFI